MGNFGVKYIKTARERINKLQVQEDLLVGALTLGGLEPRALMLVGPQTPRAIDGE